jgi:hypothetical protein
MFGEEGGEVIDIGEAETVQLVASRHWLRPSLDRIRVRECRCGSQLSVNLVLTATGPPPLFIT